MVSSSSLRSSSPRSSSRRPEAPDRHRLTRRRFLGGVAATVLAGATMVVGGLLVGAGPGSWRSRLTDPPLPQAEDEAPGSPLEPAVEAVLVAAATTLARGRAAAGWEDRCRALFEHRIRRRPGYRSVYRRFAARADAACGSGAVGSFAQASLERRRAVLARLAPAGRWRRLLLGLVDPERALYRRRVVVEILALFAHQDAWVALGSGPWPGRPRGLEGYRKAPPGRP